MTLPMLMRILVSACVLAMVLRLNRARTWNAVLLAALTVLLVLQARPILASPGYCCDVKIFWDAGRAIWEGQDPYAGPVLSTPNTLPLFALFALMPGPVFAWVWKWFCIFGCGVLCLLSSRLIAARAPSSSAKSLTGIDLIGLSGVVMLSDVSMRNSALGGQLNVWTAVLLLLGLISYERGRLGLAGIALALACVKVHSVLPFLVMFSPRRCARLWIAFGITIVSLVLLSGPPATLLARVSGMLANIHALSLPGGGNDYSFQGPANCGILGFNHVLYRLGLRDRFVIGVLHIVLNLALMLWAMIRVLRGELSRCAKCSLLALVSVIFLYHRLYDTVILALPLTCAVSLARTDVTRSGRWLHSFVGGAIVMVMCVPEYTYVVLAGAKLPLVLQSIVLPAPFWMILSALVAFDLAERVEGAAGAARLDGPKVSCGLAIQ
jgi:Glycosyltransferase family 87